MSSFLELRLVLFAGVAIFVLAGAMLAVILLMRLRLVAYEARSKRFVAIWKGLLAESLVESTRKLPPIRKADELMFLSLWNYFQESLRGEAKERLNQIARATGMDEAAKRAFANGTMRARLMAVTALGHLRERSMWEELAQLAGGKQPFLSLAAARALIHIDARAAMAIVIPLLSSRTDWSPVKVSGILNEAGPGIIAEPLAQAAVSAPPEHAVRLIRYVESTRSTAALPALRRMMLEQSPDEQMIPACLHLLGQFGDPRDLAIVRDYIRHPSWPIRVQAATALGRMATQEDERTLIGMLLDDQWWVRYRAAEALARLSFIGRERLSQIGAGQTDPKAKEVLMPFLSASQNY